jgi:hypothetical protein
MARTNLDRDDPNSPLNHTLGPSSEQFWKDLDELDRMTTVTRRRLAKSRSFWEMFNPEAREGVPTAIANDAQFARLSLAEQPESDDVDQNELPAFFSNAQRTLEGGSLQDDRNH